MNRCNINLYDGRCWLTTGLFTTCNHSSSSSSSLGAECLLVEAVHTQSTAQNVAMQYL
jgi:hypothetical protein